MMTNNMDYEEIILARAEVMDWGDDYVDDDAEVEEHYNPVIMRMIAEKGV